MYLSISFFVLYNILLQVNCLYLDDICSRINTTATCVPLITCKPLMNEIGISGNPMPHWLSKKLHSLGCGFNQDGPKVCCESANGSSDRSKETPNNNNAIDQNDKEKKINKTVTNSRHSGSLTDHPNFHLLPTECGVSDGNRIAGGEVTALFEMPWMVLLSYRHIDLGPYYGCGGTLINEWYVLTAAHCINLLSVKLQLNGVILGEHDTRQDPDCYEKDNCGPPVKNVTIAETIVHPEYKETRISYDIALIRLSEPADFSLKSMKPICLPTTKEIQLEESTGKSGEAAGWGITEDEIQSPVLLSVELPIVPLAQCREMYKGLLKLDDSQLCAGGVKNKDSCNGDSGGPLLYVSWVGPVPRYTQRGIVSYGLRDCAFGGYPTIYTKVSYYIEWILDSIRE